MTKLNSQFSRTIGAILALMLFGPVLFAIAIFLGANPLDGLFGVSENTPLQKNVLGLGFYSTIFGWAIAPFFSLAVAIQHRRTDRRYFIVLFIIGMCSFALYLTLWPLYYF